MKYKTKLIAIISVIGLGIILGVLILRSESPIEFSQNEEKTEDIQNESKIYISLNDKEREKVDIQIKVAGPEVLQSTLIFPGEIEFNPKRISDVVPLVDGVATEVHKFIGDKVIKGETLAVLESQTLAELRSQYLVALRQLDFTKVIADREEILWKEKVSAQQDYLAAKIDRSKAEVLVKAAKQKLLALGMPESHLSEDSHIPFNRYELHAPFDGEIVQQNLVLGEAAAPSVAVFSIADLSTVWGEITIYTKDLNAVQVGQEVVIEATDTGLTTIGTLFYIGPLVGQRTRSAIAYVEIPNVQGYWRPGLFINARISRKQNKIPIAVDHEAIQTYEDSPIIFVQHGDKFEARSVTLGERDDQWVEVREGLAAGEFYVAHNSFFLKAELNGLLNNDEDAE
ncbi:efflux RND transporter periplasmic adaptor subunit [Candidatus Nitrosacidococcus tergens]|uniref:Efflux transporter, RND family, MFP subunit n=1 Tax=Candidatus Nitrosacidococcus tergens TaxID=553981 RepID=A0A7G1Q8K6_9GAMM|nr:efflux RND transporter periplasmic adaptor subunit [Candidatus Nitrosacidococcus tergens]CAB1275311.1 Efflux transporter, RND family, MFP subunit [Candidatus Nitrosacidococcus tergens]